jgi:hypothetical protein
MAGDTLELAGGKLDKTPKIYYELAYILYSLDKSLI